MKQNNRLLGVLPAIALISILSACTFPKQETSTTGTPAAAPSPSAAKSSKVPPPSAGIAALNEGIGLYDQGDYNDAIKKLSGSADIWTSDKPTQLSALKYMAFSYCVTSRQTLCRQQFEKAVQLDNSFDLAPGERMHPLWGPAFAQAKKNVLNPPASKAEKTSSKRKKTKSQASQKKVEPKKVEQ